MKNLSVEHLAKIIWDYHHLHQPLQKEDVMLVLGSNDPRVAQYAATLFLQGYAPHVVVSGGVAHQNDLLKTAWEGTEAEHFARIMIGHGVPADKIIMEGNAQNTGENFSLSRPLIERVHPAFQTVLVVTKPYMERRAWATGQKQWPDKTLRVTSLPVSWEEDCCGLLSKDDVINIMMGDLQRIDLYGRKGFQLPQEIPAEVWWAFEELKKRGFTKHLLAE